MDKEEEWSGEDRLIKKISFNQKKEIPDLRTFFVDLSLQNTINAIREGCKSRNSLYLGFEIT